MTTNKRVQWIVTAAAILLLIILWITKGQERKPLNPVQPGKTLPMPDDNRVNDKIDRDTRWAQITTSEKIAQLSADIHWHVVGTGA